MDSLTKSVRRPFSDDEQTLWPSPVLLHVAIPFGDSRLNLAVLGLFVQVARFQLADLQLVANGTLSTLRTVPRTILHSLVVCTYPCVRSTET